MAIVETRSGSTGNDATVIAELHEMVAPQREAFWADAPRGRGLTKKPLRS
jgi:hypothetical protein